MKVLRLIVTILVVMVLIPAATAWAAPPGDRVDGGVVHLKLDNGMRKRLAKQGVRLVGLKPAKASRSGLTLPISSGLFGLKAGRGHLDLRGGFKLVAGGRSVRVKRLVLHTGIRSINGVIDGVRQIQVAQFSALRKTFDGFDLDLRLNRLRPGPKIAGLINHELRIGRTFAAGRRLGSATAAVEFESLAVRSGEITLRVDPGFEDKLTSLGATIGSYGSARLLGTAPMVISMPLEGGQIAPDIPSGTLLTRGGFAITQAEGPFVNSMGFLGEELILDVHILTGEVTHSRGALSGVFAVLPYLGTSLRADPNSGEISSSPLPTVFHQGVVKVMNEVLGAPKGHPELFTDSETFGTIAFGVQTR